MCKNREKKHVNRGLSDSVAQEISGSDMVCKGRNKIEKYRPPGDPNKIATSRGYGRAKIARKVATKRGELRDGLASPSRRYKSQTTAGRSRAWRSQTGEDALIYSSTKVLFSCIKVNL